MEGHGCSEPSVISDAYWYEDLGQRIFQVHISGIRSLDICVLFMKQPAETYSFQRSTRTICIKDIVYPRSRSH